MKLKFKEAYQGWAAVGLGGLRTERVEAGEHEVTEEFADYLLEKFPHLVEVVEEAEPAPVAPVERKRRVQK